jgi:hypothetical protein
LGLSIIFLLASKKFGQMQNSGLRWVVVKFVAYHGGDSFNGPGCHKLLQNTLNVQILHKSQT